MGCRSRAALLFTSPPDGNLRVEMLPTAALAPYAANARQHPEAQLQQLAASIREFGFNVPVLPELRVT